MNNTFSQHWVSDEEKLEAFVLHKIDKEEISNLTAHLEKCEECRKRVQEERELRTGIQKFGRMEMKRRLKLQLRRDRSRRLEWAHIASIAAAIIVVFSAVLTVRWFFDIEKEKTQVREIILQESKPAERAMWIIGKVIEIKDKSGSLAHSRTSTASIAKNEPEFRDNTRFEAEARQKLTVESNVKSDNIENFAAKESPAIVSEEKTEQHDEVNSKAKGVMSSRAVNDLKSRADASSRTAQSAATILKKKLDTRDSVGSKIKETPTLAAEDKLESRIGFGSNIKQGSAPTTESKSELRKPAFAEARRGPTMTAKKVLKDKKAPAVLVRRGDLKDLPVSMRNGDASVIHTRLERTPQGVLLTFYSSAITDSVATDIETIAPDSIIVTFRNRQIAYHIPGGWAGKM